MTEPPTPAGKVWAHVGQPFDETQFDVVLIGAGRMGAMFAHYLRQLAPHLSLLIVEEGGLPNEEGATILAPGLWTTLDLPAALHARANWSREQLQTAFGDVQFRARPLVELHAAQEDGAFEWSRQLLPPEALALIDADALPLARADAEAATYRPASVAHNAAQQAIRAGANLLLNTRATPHAGRVKLERLTVTNTHQIVTHETVWVQAGAVVVAAGAAGPSLVEYHLGQHTNHARVFQQYPRLEQPSTPDTPTLRVGPLTLLPQHGGFTLIPAPHHRDSHGYQPTGGTLTGVPTGLRREILEDLVELMTAVPALAGIGLQLGRSISDIPGAWVALPHGKTAGLPLWQDVGSPEHPAYLLLGGPHADTLGPSTAYELAEHLAGEKGL